MSNNLWATNFSGDFVPGSNDHKSYWMGSGGLLGSLEGCRDAGTSVGGSNVVVEATQIPTWLLVAAGITAVLFFMKKR